MKGFTRYAVVGLSSHLADVGLLYLMVEFASVGYLTSVSLAFVTATCLNFLLNKVWAFRSKGSGAAEFARYLTLLAVNGLLTLAWMYGAVEWLGLDYLWAKFLVMSSIAFWNFFLYRRYVYRSGPAGLPGLRSVLGTPVRR
jgi:putative flippase GtrA